MNNKVLLCSTRNSISSRAGRAGPREQPVPSACPLVGDAIQSLERREAASQARCCHSSAPPPSAPRLPELSWPKTLMQLQRMPKRLPNHDWRRTFYHKQRGSLIPHLSRRPALPQIASRFLHFTTRKISPFHYNHRGVTHLPI